MPIDDLVNEYFNINQEKLKKMSLNLTTDRKNYMKSFRKNVDMYVEAKEDLEWQKKN